MPVTVTYLKQHNLNGPFELKSYDSNFEGIDNWERAVEVVRHLNPEFFQFDIESRQRRQDAETIAEKLLRMGIKEVRVNKVLLF